MYPEWSSLGTIFVKIQKIITATISCVLWFRWGILAEKVLLILDNLLCIKVFWAINRRSKKRVMLLSLGVLLNYLIYLSQFSDVSTFTSLQFCLPLFYVLLVVSVLKKGQVYTWTLQHPEFLCKILKLHKSYTGEREQPLSFYALWYCNCQLDYKNKHCW